MRMKKLLGMMVLVGATMLTGCGRDNDDFVFTGPETIAGAPAPIPTPDPTPDPVPVVNGFFVDATNGSDTTGAFTGGLPFQTIQAAAAAAPAGSDIVVRPGSYSGAISLEDGDRLLGSASTLAANPETGARPEMTGPVDLADGNTLDFIRIANAPTNAVQAVGQNGGTITNSEIDTVAGGDSGVFGTDVSGDWDISNNIITNTGGAGILLTTQDADIATVRINDNQITNNDNNAIGFVTSNTSQLNAQITGNTMTGNEAGFTFQVIAGQTSASCYDIEGNTNDDTYLISQNSTATGTLQVEELSNLIAVNNGSGTVTTSGGSQAPTEVADGACGF